MSRLRELWKTIKDNLSMPQLTAPMWEETMTRFDDQEARIAALEASVKSMAPGLPADLISQLLTDWEDYAARQIEAEPTALELGAAVRAAGEPPLIDLSAHQASTDSGAAGDKPASPPGQPEPAVAGDPTPAGPTETAPSSG
jgi:hypothetical protein